jgi:RNA polymerase sigma-70 factor, ECF subfamily
LANSDQSVPDPIVAGEITSQLVRWRAGDEQALAVLAPLIYPELRKVAAMQLRREGHAHTWQPTELVNETFIRLMGNQPNAAGRVHFFAVAARLMRQILVDHARRRLASKRGDGKTPIVLEEILHKITHKQDEVIVALHDALTELAALDARKAKVVDLRFFGGMTHQEIADYVGVSLATVGNDLRFAEAWLKREMGPDLAAWDIN